MLLARTSTDVRGDEWLRAAFLGETVGQQLPGLLRQLLLLGQGLVEQATELGVARLLGVAPVSVVGVDGLEGVVNDAHQVVSRVTGRSRFPASHEQDAP